MPAPPTTQNYNVTLERRVENRARVAMLLVDGLSATDVRIVVRDDDDALLQNADAPLPIIKLVAKDMGRIRLTPVREIELKISIRSTKEKANSATLQTVVANVEEWLDNTNLKTQLDDATTGVRVMLVNRNPGTQFDLINNIREPSYTISIRAVPSELTI